MAVGALSNFTIVKKKKKYIPDFFNTYSLYATFIGIIASYGLIGLDQVYLRLSKIETKSVVIGKDIYLSIISALIFVPFLFSVYFYKNYQNFTLLPLYISGVSINAIILAYNTYRLKKIFVISQLFKNGYRVVFLLTIVCSGIFYNLTKAQLVNSLSLILIIFGLYSFWKIKRKIKTTPIKTTNFLNVFLSFSVNIALVTLLGFGERLLIANELGEDSLGKYFYYATVFLFPLSLLQQYIGFKELVRFKEKLNKKKVVSKVSEIAVLGIIVILLIFGIVFVDNGRFLEVNLKNDLGLIILLSLLGIVKLIYGLFSAILGAKADSKELYNLNIYTSIIIVISISSLYLLNSITLNFIALSLIFIFLFRTLFIYQRYVK